MPGRWMASRYFTPAPPPPWPEKTSTAQTVRVLVVVGCKICGELFPRLKTFASSFAPPAFIHSLSPLVVVVHSLLIVGGTACKLQSATEEQEHLLQATRPPPPIRHRQRFMDSLGAICFDGQALLHWRAVPLFPPTLTASAHQLYIDCWPFHIYCRD